METSAHVLFMMQKVSEQIQQNRHYGQSVEINFCFFPDTAGCGRFSASWNYVFFEEH